MYSSFSPLLFLHCLFYLFPIAITSQKVSRWFYFWLFFINVNEFWLEIQRRLLTFYFFFFFLKMSLFSIRNSLSGSKGVSSEVKRMKHELGSYNSSMVLLCLYCNITYIQHICYDFATCVSSLALPPHSLLLILHLQEQIINKILSSSALNFLIYSNLFSWRVVGPSMKDFSFSPALGNRKEGILDLSTQIAKIQNLQTLY